MTDEAKRFRYSTSSLADYKACPLSHFFKRELGLKVVELDHKAEHHRAFGSAVHEALDLLYKMHPLERAIEAFHASYPEQLDPEDQAKTKEAGEAMLREYFDHYSSHRDRTGDELDPNWIPRSCEVLERFQGYVDAEFVVKLDLVVEDAQTGNIYGIDHKVTKRALSSYNSWDFWNRFDPHSQITRYYSWIEKEFGRCDGFYVNAIGMYYRSRAYKGEPAGAYRKFGRQLFHRTSEQLAAERTDTMRWIEDLESARAAHLAGVPGAWRANTEHCPFCDFRDGICKPGYQWPQDRDLIRLTWEEKGNALWRNGA